jgi:hypothetical protein
MRVVALTLCLTSAVLAAQAQDIIIEAGRGQNSDHYREISGAWESGDAGRGDKSSVAGLTRTCDARKLKVPAPNTAEARFYPRFTAPGHYCVYITWPRTANAKNVTMLVRHADTQVNRNGVQNGTGYRITGTASQWIFLGEYDFAGGEDEYVALRAEAANTQPNEPTKPGCVVADAVRFTQTPLTPADGAALFRQDQAVMLRAMAAGKPIPGHAGPGLMAILNNLSNDEITKATNEVKDSWIASGNNVPTVNSITWSTDIGKAVEAAKSAQKRVLVYARAGENARCASYDAMLTNNKALVDLVCAKYVPVKLDIEADSALATQLGIFRAGTFIVYDSSGAGLKKVDDELEAAQLLNALNF